MSLENNLINIQKKIKNAVERSPWKQSVELIAVSKLQSVGKIKELYALGQRSFGENYLQELQEKKSQFIQEKIVWHFIGSLQSKKIKKLVGNVEYIHSIDRLEHLIAVNDEAEKQKKVQKVLLQVNVAEEDSKSGFDRDELESVLLESENLNSVVVAGLMAMPPLVDDGEDNRIYFRAMRKMLTELSSSTRHPDQFINLSMGTSSDFEVAIEEGATMVRVGSELMGPRN
ncbi:MAG: YggS family pyridoxal phosphate-dependent enzyme [Bdellovibrionales bacterium]